MFGVVKEMLGESIERSGGRERQNRLLCWHWTRFSTMRKDREGKGAVTVDGGRVTDGS